MAGKKRGNPNWTKGGASPNPSGGPKTAEEWNVDAATGAKFDGWVSALTGIGTPERDKRLSHQIQAPTLSYQQICDLWRVDDVAKRAIEAPAAECFREGYEITIGDEGSYEDLKESIEEKLLELGVDAAIERAYRLERAFGGSAILLGADDGRPLDRPLELARVDSLDWINVLEPLELYPASFYDNPAAPKYGQPEYYQVNNFTQNRGIGPKPSKKPAKPLSQYIHESRLVVFEGVKVSQYQAQVSYIAPNWGDSALLSMVEVLRDFNVAWHSAGLLATDFSQPVITMENLMTLVSKNEEGLRNRMAALELSRSTARAILLGKGEKFERQTTSLSGLSELLMNLGQRLSAAIDIPLMMLLGTSPAGLGNPGQNDLTTWYNRIRAIQRRRLSPIIRLIVRMIMQSLRKRKIPKKWGVRWNELERQSDAQRAESRLTQARTDSMYVKAGVLTPDEVRRSRFVGEYSFETQVEENKKAPGFIAPLPTGVMPGSTPAAALGKTGPNAHSVTSYARRNPTAPRLGANPSEGGDKAPRGDGLEYTAQHELEGKRRTLDEAIANNYDAEVVKLLERLVEEAELDAFACEKGTCGLDCVYDHPARTDEDGDGKRVTFAGFPVCIESPKGSYRYWTDTDGTPGKTKMRFNYGYIEGSHGTDGDSVDVYLGPNPDAQWVYIVHQNKKPDFVQYDEDKVMLGFDSANHAHDAYLSLYDDERFLGSMSMMLLEDFRRRVMFHAGGKISNTDAKAEPSGSDQT